MLQGIAESHGAFINVQEAERGRQPGPPSVGEIWARVAPGLKTQADCIFGQLGLSARKAIRIFFSCVVLTKGIPFEVRIPSALTLPMPPPPVFYVPCAPCSMFIAPSWVRLPTTRENRLIIRHCRTR